MSANQTTIYRAIYNDEIEKYNNPELLKNSEYLKMNYCKDLYSDKNNLDYDKIAKSLGLESCEGFLHFFASEEFATKYASALNSMEPSREASVYEFSFDNELLKSCEGKGLYHGNNPFKMKFTTEEQVEYAIPIEKYNPQENFVGKLENNVEINQTLQSIPYDPDAYLY